MRHWYEVETRKVGPFKLILDWTYEDMPLGDAFDETVSDIDEMIDRCQNGTDTHYIARVRAMYDGVEMGSSALGSCYASGMEPDDDMREGIGGYLEDMIDEALKEAEAAAKGMLARLAQDFQEN